jgi:cystathionine gamma-synthase
MASGSNPFRLVMPDTRPPLHRDTSVLHAGLAPDAATGALAPAMQMATTFARDASNALVGPYLYGRYANPTRDALEHALAELEQGAVARAFASGLAAATAVLQSLAPGARVIFPDGVYSGVRSLATTVFAPWGLVPVFVDERDPAAYATAISAAPTALVWIESPSNPRWVVTDIQAVASAAHAAGARVVVDNTVATPLGQSPLDLGADLVLHSTTKAIGGHSDVTGGALVFARDDAWSSQITELQKLAGAVPSPFDCWLILRGLRTLPVRFARQCESAQRVAEFLSTHSAVSAVHYPGLPHHAGHAVATRQMRGYSGLLSFEHAGGREGALRALGALQLFARATSLGGVESMAEHRKTVESPDTPTPESLIRLSIGLEHADDLIADLRAALAM